MSNHYWPTGPAESLRTREFAEEEWSRLVLNAPRDKPSFMASLKEVNDRIIGLKVALPPLQSTIPYQEPPKDYGFVMDSNMRVASTSSLSAARGLRENLSKLMASSHAPPTSSHRRPMEPISPRATTAHTNFDILSSARRSDFLPDHANRAYDRETAQRHTDNHVSFQDQNEAYQQHDLQTQQQKAFEETTTREDTEFAEMLENFKSSNVSSARQESPERFGTETALGNAEQGTDAHSDANKNLNTQYESEDDGELEEEMEEEVIAEEVPTSKPASFATRTPLPAPVLTRLPESVSAVLAQLPAPITFATARQSTSTTEPAQETAKVTHSAPAPMRGGTVPPPVVHATPDTSKNDFATTEAPPAPASFAATDAETTKPSSEADRLSRLQAWERELQEREQKVLQYMNSLSRPLGAKKSPKPMTYDDFNDEDVHVERHQDRVHRETPATSALRGSAEIHIHNHITPPAAVAPPAAPVHSRSSYYESSTWQPSAYAPLKNYHATPATALPQPTHTEELRPPSVQTRVPQRSPYAFPPAPYSSLGSGRGTVDLSGLSLERMRELTGHY